MTLEYHINIYQKILMKDYLKPSPTNETTPLDNTSNFSDLTRKPSTKHFIIRISDISAYMFEHSWPSTSIEIKNETNFSDTTIV